MKRSPELLPGVFVTGTDTGVGKTSVAYGLVAALRVRGLRVGVMKPVASGASWDDGRWVNDDALALIEASGSALDYSLVNPYCFEPPIAPHLAAAEMGIEVEFDRLLDCARQIATNCDCLVVEGAGGWRVPLGPEGDFDEFAKRLGLPVLLVVGLRLGCLNHALLTAESIAQRGVPMAGWIANHLDPAMLRSVENLRTLESRLGPPLAVLPHSPDPGVHRDALQRAADRLMDAWSSPRESR